MGKKVFVSNKIRMVCFIFVVFLSIAFFCGTEAAWAAPTYGNVNNGSNSLYMKCLNNSEYPILDASVKEYKWIYTHSSGWSWDHTFTDIKVSKNDAITWGCMLYAVTDGDQSCMMWLSLEEGSKDTDALIEVSLNAQGGFDVANGSKTIYLNGMCTNGAAPADNIRVVDDSNFLKIDEDKVLYRKEMPDVGSMAIKDGIDIKAFMDGIDPKIVDGEYSEYTRNFKLRRCYAGLPSCANQPQQLTVRLKYNYFSARSNFAVGAQNPDYKPGSDDYAFTRRGWSSTGFVSKYTSIANDEPGSSNPNDRPVRVNVGEQVRLTFSHEIRSTQVNTKTTWGLFRGDADGVSKPLPNNNTTMRGDGYEVVKSCIGTFDRDGEECDNKIEGIGEQLGFKEILNYGETYISMVPNGYDRPPYFDGGGYFNARDVYEIIFSKKGTYKFCESISVPNGFYLTTVCAIVHVDDSYNFENEASANIVSDVIYAGETTNVETEVKVKSRQNERLGIRYVTSVDDAEVRLITFVSDGDQSGRGSSIVKSYGADLCNTFGGVMCDLNKDFAFKGRLNEELEDPGIEKNLVVGQSGNVNVYDASAGRYYCVATAVYPYITTDTDVAIDGKAPWVVKPDDYSWYVSRPDCKKIGKKPSLQVWGAGMYTAGDIALNNAEKRVVNGIYGFTLKNQSNTTVFGTWVEQNILANGIVNTASGAATGRKDGELGGSKEGKNLSVCIRSPLTMPNKNCSPIVKPGGGSFARPEGKGKLIDKLKENNCRQESSIGELSVKKGESYFYCSGGNFTINGNIRYEDGYNMISDIPKVIVYSKRDIIIGCGVTRIDAVLIAEGVINTCNNNDVNSRDRSNQLKINGAIIANKLKANRTYGASAGMESGTPAEIINYDTSLYLWGASESDVTKTGKLKVVYQTELPPRL